jgi:tRNA (guanine-N7-)-methyltransferase
MGEAETCVAAAADPMVLFEEADLPRDAIDVRAMLGVAPPADLDIGFGKGWSLREWAWTHHEGTVLGVEKRRGFVDHAVRKLGEAERLRIRIVHGDARTVLPRLVPGGFFRRCTLSFPDPWWKRRHQKRQVVGSGLAVEIARLLADGGEAFVQTDVPERAEPFRAAFVGCGLFDDV